MPICSMESARKRWVKMNTISIGAAVSRQPACIRVTIFSGLVPSYTPARADTCDRSIRSMESAVMMERLSDPRNCLDR